MPTAEMTQMNTRIPTALKKSGDAVLSRAGYTPSKAVRVLWEFAVANEDNPDVVATKLDELSHSSTPAIDERTARLLERMDELRQATSKLMGPVSYVEPLTDEELKEQAFVERYRERGLL